MAPGNNFKVASVSAPWDSKKVAVVDKLSLSEAFYVKKIKRCGHCRQVVGV